MFHTRESNGLRGRTIEDLNDLEEKGVLLSDRQNGDGQGSPGMVRRVSSRDSGKEVLREKSLEIESFEGSGLNNKRDREAFGLLVVLCELALHMDWKISEMS